MPKSLKSGQLTKIKGTESRILWIEDLAGRIGGVQMNTLEFHVWGSDGHQPDLPERMVFDIDPDEGLGLEHVSGPQPRHPRVHRPAVVAAAVRWQGLHVVVPLNPEADWTAVTSFCQNFAELLAKTEPQRFVANMRKARRKGRMFLDYLRNGQGSTAICPWSTRARAEGTVAAPVTWEELETIDRANAFDIFASAERARRPDAWKGYLETEQVLDERIQAVIRNR